jgi:leucyl aminopeptidase
MHYDLTATPSLTSHDVIIVGFVNNLPLPEVAQQIDQQHQGLASRLIARLIEPGDHLWQADINGHSLLLINCGDQQTYTPTNLRKYLIDKIASILKHRMTSVLICMPQVSQLTPDEQLQMMLLDVDASRYQLLEFRSKNNTPYSLQNVQFYLPGSQQETITTAHAIANGVTLTRNLANRPANRCTPNFLAEQAKNLAKDYPALQVKIIDRDEMQNMGMNALLAVAQGSVEPPKLIELHYNGNNDSQPVILVGKGVTFDSGGISLKSSSKMEEMKYDMAGAASVLGVIKACAALKLPINIIGLLPCTENMPSGSAVKPGDIVTSLSGQTIEIINTDAEGRLILADTLTFAQRFNPKLIIDIATLTGAVIIALGGVASGLMTKDDELAQWLANAAKASQDKVWRLPLDDAYQAAIDSNLADMVNSTETSAAGSISAGCFLSRFTEKCRWAHLDVAGTAWISGKKNGATGRPVLLLVQFLRDLITNAR